MDSIIKCHVITRYGVVLSLPASPPGRRNPSDRYGEVCVCMHVSACLNYRRVFVSREKRFDAGRQRQRRRKYGVSAVEMGWTGLRDGIGIKFQTQSED